MDFHQLLHTFVGEKVQVRFMMLKEISENVNGLFLKIGEVKCRTKVFSGGGSNIRRQRGSTAFQR